MGTLIQDLRYGIRMLLKNRAFAIVAVLTLALGIGANSAIFSVVNAVLLRPLSYKDPERLVRIWESNPQRGWPTFSASEPNFLDWQGQNQGFETMAAWRGQSFNLTETDEPERIGGGAVTASLLPLLGVQPATGRNFLPEEDQPGANNRVALISHGLWQRRFAADPATVGRALTLNDNRYTVVGILPANFDWFNETDIVVPLAANPASSRGDHRLSVFGKLKPGVTLEQARTDLEAIAGRLEQLYPDSNSGWGVRLSSFYDWIVPEETRRALLILLGAVGFVLLIACANVANLLFARASGRRREMAVRTALGAGRLRLVRQLLTECALLALLGGGLGLLLATWGVEFLQKLSPASVPRLEEVGIDPSVLGFTLGVSILAGAVFGLVPALQASRMNLNDALKEGGRGGSEGRARHRIRSFLVVSEVALALVLLVGAGLLLRSFWQLLAVSPGFQTENLLTMQLILPNQKYPTGQQKALFFRRFLEQLQAAPGVQAAAAANILPLSGGNTAIEVVIEGKSDDGGPSPSADWRMVTPEYFHTLGIPLLAGREFTEADHHDAPPVIIVSKTMAERHWPGQDPTGKRLRVGTRSAGDWWTVVGVAADARNLGLDSDPRPVIYLPYYASNWNAMNVALRTSADPTTAVSAVRAILKSLDPNLPVSNIRTMEERLSTSVAPRRFNMLLLATFAGVALLLAAVGIYGVMAYSVAQRTHEIGIRMALGARPGDVLKLIVGRGITLALIGVGIGLLASLALTRLMTSLLFGVSATDPLTFIALPLLLAGVALLACYVPARRATKVDPMVALRHE